MRALSLRSSFAKLYKSLYPQEFQRIYHSQLALRPDWRLGTVRPRRRTGPLQQRRPSGRDAIKVPLVVILCATFAFAKPPRKVNSPSPPPRAHAAPRTIKFEVEMGTTDPPHLEPGKALVYVIEDLGQCSNCTGGSTERFTNVASQKWVLMARGSGPTRAAPTFSSQPLPASTISASTGNHGSSRLPDYCARASRSLKEFWTPSNYYLLAAATEEVRLVD